MILEKQGYGYNDVSIVPAKISKIESRSECIPYSYGKTLPIFTAPMSTVVDIDSLPNWENNGITPILPRNIELESRLYASSHGKWAAYSLSEFKSNFVDTFSFPEESRLLVLVDVANGHMQYLYDLIEHAKIKAAVNRSMIIIMAGNVANPETYEWLCVNSKVDYIRLGIGGGLGCITSSNTGIHYPMASLIDECNTIKKKCMSLHLSVPVIIADGGIRNYSDVIKALALGADAVMIGGLFAGFFESASPILGLEIDENWTEEEKRKLIEYRQLEKVFYGMASAQGQKDISGGKTKTSEGISKIIPVKYTTACWKDNMAAYLRSAMSYCNCKYLSDFIGNQILIKNSPAEIAAVNK